MINKLLNLILLTTTFAAFGQQKVALSLDDAIARARLKSVDAEVALGELRSAYWEYRTYRADLLPEVNFDATVPSYHKQYSTYMNDEGNYSFVQNNNLQIDGQLSVDQKIWFTGGTISLTSQLDFLRQLDGIKYNRFMTVPVALTLNQPIFGVNTVKWNRKIEPVRYSEAKAKFLSATEEVAMKAVNYYFNLLMSRENLSIAMQNHENAQRLYQVAVEKRNMGQISKNDLLQMELNLLNAKSDLTECQSNVKSNMFTLRSFLDFSEDVDIEPEVPSAVPNVDITFDDALNRALTNNKFSKNLRRRQLEAEYQVAQAKGNMRQISLFAQIGFTGADHDISPAYSNLRSNQIVELGG
ncbi:MAG: TolC family protein, partial [Muribaculaceae bacterium]|nr:TolC family protein [Muribaculaceae bacterium]